MRAATATLDAMHAADPETRNRTIMKHDAGHVDFTDFRFSSPAAFPRRPTLPVWVVLADRQV
jgi:hypothetical protein